MNGRSGCTTIRSAQAEDSALLHGMVCGMARDVGRSHVVRSTPEDLLRLGFGADPIFRSLIAEQDGEPVGCCLYHPIFSSWLGQAGLYISDIYVESASRGFGLGRKMITRVARLGRESGCQYIHLTVHDNNVAAQQFYDRLGFSRVTGEQTCAVAQDRFVALADMPSG